MALNKNPTAIIPQPTTAIKVNINGNFNTLRSIIISGNDRAMTDIIKARAVPSEAPFSISTETIGTIPAAFEYKGMPISTESGTEYQADFPINETMNSCGT